jgi:DNA topoisomerase-1
MTKLLIVESPAKAKTIAKYLNNEYIVRASVGHVRDLPKSNKQAIDIEGGFIPHYEISHGKEHVIHELKTLADKADEIVLATDPDREGEAIAWHLFEALKLPKKKTKRITFNEITKEAVQEAMKQPRSIDEHLREAQEARRVLDRLVGYDLSGLIWKKVRYGLSAGRVQSPALRILMEREREIRAFIPEAYWVITADSKTKKGELITFKCVEEPRNKNKVDSILKIGRASDWTITDVTESGMKRTPRPPFTTSTIQQAASTRLGFSPARTMGVAQKLYEAGHITYMRTDSVTLSAVAVASIAKLVEKEYGKEYVEVRAYKTKSKNAQEAHEAIRPAHVEKESAGANPEQKMLYQLIRERTIASQMSDAEMLRTKITARPKNAEVPDFTANGSRVVFDGWLRADPRARGEDVELPKVTVGEAVEILKLDAEGKHTEPPGRYTEAGLVKELEKRGIGRPSTYASIMKTLNDRGYVIKEGRTLMPTDTGDVVSTFLEQNFEKYISDSFTAEMEDELDEIARGERKYVATLKTFYGPFQKDVKAREKDATKLTDLGPAPEEFPCPICGKPMVYKLSRSGKFMSCSNFPECKGARLENGGEVKTEDPIGTHPETGENIYVMNGRFGPYVQQGETPEKVKGKKKAVAEKPRRASIPKEVDPMSVSLEQALVYLSLPRVVGVHPESGSDITAAVGRFGPFIVHEGDFRSVKAPDDVYTITLPRALEILKEEKKGRRGETMVKEIGLHPRTKKPIKVFESKSGMYLKKGFKRISLPDGIDLEKFSVDDALELLKA